MTRDELAALVAALGDLVPVIRNADPADKADLYAQLGLTLTYRPQKRLVEASVRPSLHMCKGLCPRSESPGAYMPAITGELVLRDGGDRAGRRLDQADDDRDVWRRWR